jgi:hypothetical protein
MEDLLVQIIGWIGTFLIVLAYFLVTYNKVSSTGKTYALMNLFGAIGIGINVYFHRAWPAVIMELIWALIAISSLVKIAVKRK